MPKDNRLGTLTLVLVLAASAFPAGAAERKSTPADERCAAPDSAEQRVYWGDLHTHTAFSMDAYVLNTQSTPEDALAFAKGGPATLHTGGERRLERPLDFAAVTDHAEYFGLTQVCLDEPDHPYCKNLAEAAQEDSFRGFREIFLPLIVGGKRNCLVDDKACRVAERSLWQRTIAAANAAPVSGQPRPITCTGTAI